MSRVTGSDTFDQFLEFAELLCGVARWCELGCAHALREGMLMVDPLVQDHWARDHLVLADRRLGFLDCPVVHEGAVDHHGRGTLREPGYVDGGVDW